MSGKLNSYCINSVLSKYGIYTLYGLPKTDCFTEEQWSKLRQHFDYSFNDRLEGGFLLGDVIWYFENKNHKYPFVLQFLKELKDYKFEDHSVETVSRQLITFLLSIDPNSIGKKKEFYTNRYKVKKAKKVLKDMDLEIAFDN